jgi:hypothetical protein
MRCPLHLLLQELLSSLFQNASLNRHSREHVFRQKQEQEFSGLTSHDML